MAKFLLAVLLFFVVNTVSMASMLTSLCYHGVGPELAGSYNVSRTEFVAQMEYLKTNGYQPVGLSLLSDVRQGKAELPDKAILLTFDDGLSSYYDFVVPVLKKYGYPSVISVVTHWLDGKNVPDNYKDKLINWKQLRQLDKAPLVEIISHSDNLHHGITLNPQGNKAAAGATREYLPFHMRYESEKEFRQRIYNDILHSSLRLKEMIGHPPVAIAWPYGAYEQTLIEEAERVGIDFKLSLNDGPTDILSSSSINRIAVQRQWNLEELASELNYDDLNTIQHRVVAFNLSPFNGESPLKQERALSHLLDTVKALGVNTVLISPFTDDYSAAYFQNSQLPVASNILSNVMHQIRTRIPLKYLYLTIPANIKVRNSEELYRDLARLHYFNGIIFEDEARNRINEKKIKKVIKYYRQRVKFGLREENDSEFDFALFYVDSKQKQKIFFKYINNNKIASGKVIAIAKKAPSMQDNSLLELLKKFRGNGLIHYGYYMDEYIAGEQDKENIVTELSKLTVVGG